MTVTALTPSSPDLDAWDYSRTPPMYAPYVGGEARQTLAELRGIIEHAITHHPRSLQKRIGPSELGTPCDHCLAAKLAGWEQTPDGVPWLPTIGTAVHAWLQEAVDTWQTSKNLPATTGRRWLTERRVSVGEVGGVEITGSCDLFDVATGTVVDVKIVGPSTLRTAKRGPSDTYRRQVNLYGRGWTRAGFQVANVAIAYLPRNAVSLDQAVWWSDTYDEPLALATLQRANTVANTLTALTPLGASARDAWITGRPRAAGCFDCARYPDNPTPTTASPLAEELGLGSIAPTGAPTQQGATP